MRYALISDIHSNLPALEAVLMDIAAREGITATYHLGDLVGYGPWPNETVALLRECVGTERNPHAGSLNSPCQAAITGMSQLGNEVGQTVQSQWLGRL